MSKTVGVMCDRCGMSWSEAVQRGRSAEQQRSDLADDGWSVREAFGRDTCAECIAEINETMERNGDELLARVTKRLTPTTPVK